jgi:hypothetical protein
MTTVYYPNTVEGLQPTENEVTWTSAISNRGNILGKRWKTIGELFHRSNPACGDLTNSTQALLFVNFQISNIPNVISGVKIQVLSQRNGRVADQVIQLVYQGQPIGVNNFNYYTDTEGHLAVQNNAEYGGQTDLWGAELTAEMVRDPSFGVMLKFQAHPYYPHSCGLLLDSVSLTVY